ncbi:MAG: hypothetical protein EZS28_023658 [Streblomastix strix]|uniref:Uncharacterized protein n=1 Tax=Streblomastix strix TaxID=222440 RepID=A0A5J4VEJ3_9EUKA|nr:MAG: hypothetical protein EZS28_023658 [Streblomastix strix]
MQNYGKHILTLDKKKLFVLILFFDLTVNNSVTVSPLESIVQGKRHCDAFIDVPLVDVAAAVTTAYYYRYNKDITFSGVMN